MTHGAPASSNEPSHTTEAIVHEHDPMRTYLIVFGALAVLLIATVLASYLPTTEPWSFLIALIIAVVKAVLVILFFMHVKDASRVTWLFCGCSFLWLVIMLGLTFSDYMTRYKIEGSVGGNTQNVPRKWPRSDDLLGVAITKSMSNRVRAILEQIKELPETELQELQAEMDRLEEEELAQLTPKAREQAKAEGIDDEVIARAVESLRYGDQKTK